MTTIPAIVLDQVTGGVRKVKVPSFAETRRSIAREVAGRSFPWRSGGDGEFVWVGRSID